MKVIKKHQYLSLAEPQVVTIKEVRLMDAYCNYNRHRFVIALSKPIKWKIEKLTPFEGEFEVFSRTMWRFIYDKFNKKYATNPW